MRHQPFKAGATIAAENGATDRQLMALYESAAAIVVTVEFLVDLVEPGVQLIFEPLP